MMIRPGGKYWQVTVRRPDDRVIVTTTSRGVAPGIAVKRVLDACCPSLRVNDWVVVTVERIEGGS